GLGIDLAVYGDLLFGMYKTFHKHEEARGIGLYITRNQIEAMKGSVFVESEVGAGTSFKIVFNDM
ncbi:MAG: ATP-binding protein, partial [Flavobacterium sp.]